MKKKSTNKITDVQKYLEEINYIENGPKYEPPEWSKFKPDSVSPDKKKSSHDD